ncbi:MULTISPECIES: hypothetical protein [Micrococcales]|uniref:hypothetical protein n=1 Tax=Micrococcales TaxID=85006 RepID=UPI00259A5A34|nr:MULTISPECIES: hypothetical protein [Micrococcales]
MSTNVTWEEPPTTKGGGAFKMPAIAEQLKTRPGQWARIEAKQSAATNYAKRHPEIEITARNKGKTDEAVYARYIGTETPNA